MTEPTISESAALEETASDRNGVESVRRWPASMAFLTSGVLPATTARRTGHVSLQRAYVVHVVAALVALWVITLLAAFDGTSGPVSLAAIVAEIPTVVGNALNEIAMYPRATTFFILGVVLAIELGFLAVAFLVMPWGARDEPLRESYRHALRHTWLHSAHVCLMILLAGTAMTIVNRDLWASIRSYPSLPARPQRPIVPVAQQAAEWQAYEVAMADYYEERSRVHEAWAVQQRWYALHPEIVIVNSIFSSLVWWFFALLRAVGVHRSTPPITRTPQCEVCGYNLVTMAMESRCPECGEPVVASLGEVARPGTAWLHRRETGRIIAWWKSASCAMFRPEQLGRQIMLTRSDRDHRGFLLMHLPLFVLLGVLVFPCLFAISTGKNPFGQVEVFATTIPVGVYLAAMVPVAIALLGALLVGGVVSLGEKRNLLPATVQIASYLAVYLALWALFAVVSGLAVSLLIEERAFHLVEEILHIDNDVASTLSWLVPNAAFAVLFLRQLARGTNAARYSNR